ncbi:MAG: DUF3394 domain-containing protein, partial [Pseudomonadota bacterium]
VSSLMAPVIVSVGAQSGLVVPLIAVHMFVFYFGILADDTPPVGLAAYAAAAISRGDPIRTGVQGFMYDIRTALLPFIFIFNTDLLLIDVGPLQAIYVFATALVAMLCFAAATQGYFVAKCRAWEIVALLLVAFTLFRPGFWLDLVQAPYERTTGPAVLEAVAAQPEGGTIRLRIEGPDFDTGQVRGTTIAPGLGEAGDGAERLDRLGLTVFVEGDALILEEPFPGTPYFETLANEYDFYGAEPVRILYAQVEAERLPKEVFFLPAFLLLALVVAVQNRRKTQPAF